MRVVSQIQKELKKQLSVKVDAKEKPSEHRRHSLDFTRLPVASASSSNDPPDISEFALQSLVKKLTSEETVQWSNVVENWLSRPNPLGGAEAESQKPTSSSSSVMKASHLPSSAVHVPKPRVPAAVTPLNFSARDVPPRSGGSTEQHRLISRPQDVHLRSNGSTEQQRVIPKPQDVRAGSSGNAEQDRLFSGQHTDVTSRLPKQENVIKKDTKPSPTPLVIRKEEHRDDPRLKMRRSLDEEPSTGLKSPNMPQTSHGTPYNAQEALQAQGVKMDSTSTAPVATSSTTTPSTPPTPHVKYQVNDKSLKELLDKIHLPKRDESSAYKVNVDDGTRRALEMMKQQEGAKRTEPELQDAKAIAMDKKADGKLDTTEHTNNEKSVKRSSSSVSATQEKGKRIKADQVNPFSENVSTVIAEVQTLSTREQPTKHEGSRKGERQTSTERSEKKPLNSSQVKQSKNQIDSSSGQEITKPVVKTAVPELAEAPFPKISSLDVLRSPPTPDQMSKAPKLKLILKPKEPKEVSRESPTSDISESSENKLAKQHKETECEQNGDLQRDRKLVDSPVSMDISPQCTTPTGSGSVSPITVVSSKGRYHAPVPPTATVTAPVHSAQTYSTPVCSAFPFTPPLPQGPFRSPILPCSSQPRPPPAGQQPVHPMPFGPPLPAASSSSTTAPLAGAPPMLHSSSISSAPTGGSLPFGSPIQAPSSFVPQPAIPPSPVSPATSAPPTMGTFTGNPSFPPLPPAHPTSHQRKNSLDALPNASASSSTGHFPPTFPGQQWTAAPPHSQRFGFPTNMAPLPGVVAMPPTEVPQWPANSALPRPGLPPPGPLPPAGRPPQVFPQQLGVPSQTAPFAGSPAERPIVQPRGGGFVPIGVPRFHVPPAGPALPQLGGVPVVAQMGPVHPMFGTPPTQLQFQPWIPFQQPAPIGYWEAPIKAQTVPSGKSTGHLGRTPSHLSGQKHSKDSQPTTPSLPQKSTDSGVEKAQKENREQIQGNSKDVHSEKGVDKETSNAHSEKQKDIAVRKPEVTGANNSKEDKAVTTSSNDKKATPSQDKEIISEAVGESVASNLKQLSGNTADAKVKDSEQLSGGQTSQLEPKKPPSKIASSLDSASSQENQNEDGKEGRLCREESKTQTNKGLVEKDDAESKSSKICLEVEESCQEAVAEIEISSSQDTKELSGNLTDKHSIVSVKENRGDVAEVDPSFCLPTKTYQTEAERKGSNAVSKIYDILRQNAQQSRSETDSADQGEEEDLEDPDKPDHPEPSVMDVELNADEEGGNRLELESYGGRQIKLNRPATGHCSAFNRQNMLNLGILEGIHYR